MNNDFSRIASLLLIVIVLSGCNRNSAVLLLEGSSSDIATRFGFGMPIWRFSIFNELVTNEGTMRLTQTEFIPPGARSSVCITSLMNEDGRVIYSIESYSGEIEVAEVLRDKGVVRLVGFMQARIGLSIDQSTQVPDEAPRGNIIDFTNPRAPILRRETNVDTGADEAGHARLGASPNP